MSENFRNADRVSDSSIGNSGSSINAQNLFEEQANVRHVPKEATQQMGGSENQVHAMPKEPSLLKQSDANGQITRTEAPTPPPTAEGNAERDGTRVPPRNAEGHAERIESSVPPRNAEGHAERNESHVSGRGGNHEVREITKEQPTAQTPQGRVGGAIAGDRTRPVDPIDLSPNPYNNPNVSWQTDSQTAERNNPTREVSPGPKFRPDASETITRNQPGSTPPRPLPFPPIQLDPQPGPRPGTPEWDHRPIPEVNRPTWGR